MARICYGANFSGTVNGRPRVVGSGPTDDPLTGAAEALVNTNIATLVADGASPTQAHVNTLNTNWTAFKAGPVYSDVIVSINTANVGTRAHLRAALDAIYNEAAMSSLLTA